jgi:fumarylpyruvate hydrolase
MVRLRKLAGSYRPVCTGSVGRGAAALQAGLAQGHVARVISRGVLLKRSRSIALAPVRRIYCIGRNYAAHAREMGSFDPNREPPFFFQKPTDAIQNVRPARWPTTPIRRSPRTTTTRWSWWWRSAAAGATSRGHALEHVWGYTLGLDMTRRDLQRAMGDEKKPWEIGKSFDHSAP